MGLWAWFVYYYAYVISTFVTPFSLMVWQNAYTTNTLLVIQEVADAFGLILVSLVFLLSQLLSRNSMLSIFLSKKQPSDTRSIHNTDRTDPRLNWQPLFIFSSSLQHLQVVAQLITIKFVNFIKK